MTPTVRVIGDKEMGDLLRNADPAMRAALRGELDDIGREIVAKAKALAPRRTGGLAGRIIHFFGERRRAVVGQTTTRGGKVRDLRRLVPVDVAYEGGKIRLQVMPTGSVAHLMERGVNATRKGHHRRVTRRNVQIWTAKGLKTKKELKGKAWVKPHQLTIAPRRFFWPAVDSVGGESAIFGRLQGVIDSLVGNTNAEAA